jgi:chromosome segregation ATPase
MCASDAGSGAATCSARHAVARLQPGLHSRAHAGLRAVLLRAPTRSALIAVLLAISGATLMPGPVVAQEDKRLTLARESLRRAQTALQAAQQEKQALQRDKVTLEADRMSLEQALAAARKAEKAALGQRQALDAEVRRVGAERDRLAAELASLRSDQAAVVLQLEETQRQLASAVLARDEQLRLKAVLLALLERSVATLSEAEAKNRELYRLGQQVLDAWRGATPEAQRAESEPLLGIASVQLEDQAESLRRLLDAQRTAPSK